jgi:hypothetical protein
MDIVTAGQADGISRIVTGDTSQVRSTASAGALAEPAIGTV